MKIRSDCYVSIDYRLTSDAGELIDESEDGKPISFIFGRGQMVPGLEEKLDGMDVGQQADIVVEPDKGYGPVKEELFRTLPRDAFPEDIDLVPGLHLRASGPHGPLTLSVRSVDDESVTVDLNHPLAGQRLHFHIRIVESREATDDEMVSMLAGCERSDCEGCCGACH